MTPLNASIDGSSLPSSVIIDRDGYYNSVEDANKRSTIMSGRNYNNINYSSTSTSTSTFAVDSSHNSPLSSAKKYTTMVIHPKDTSDSGDYNNNDEVTYTVSEEEEDPLRLLEKSLLEEQEQEQDLNNNAVADDNNKSKNFSSRKRRRSSLVRFAPQEAVSEGIMIHKMKTNVKKSTNNPTRHKQLQSDTNNSNGSEEQETAQEEEPSSSSALWYTPQELKRIQQSVVVAVKKYEKVKPFEVDLDDCDYIGLNSLDRFSLHKRKRRRRVRNQMLDTCYAVKEFVTSTTTAFQTHHHHDHDHDHQEIMLSQLLQRYSNPMVLEAVQSASASASATLLLSLSLSQQQRTRTTITNY
jgi:hypothetical protein